MSPDPNDEELRVPWALKPPRRKGSGRGPSPLQRVTSTAGSIAALAPSTLGLVRHGLLEQQLTLPFQAPKTMFNVRIGGARRVAAQSWSLERFKRVKAAAGGVTVNDVILAMCAGALRAYLLEHSALPETPLVAMVPVSLRSDKDHDRGGNMVGTVLCNLATHLDDPAKRLDAIHASMAENKKVFTQLPQIEQFALSAFLSGGVALALVPGFVSNAPPPFNIVISNVPGPREPPLLEWRAVRRQLPVVDRPGRASVEHHHDQQRRQPRLRPSRLPGQRAAPAASPRPPRDIAEGPGTRRRRLTHA